MRKEIDNNNKREVNMSLKKEIVTLEIMLNGIKGVDDILQMIKDCIDNGETEDAKMWISDLQDELYDNGVRG
jgi:nitrogen regulatory protein PII